jgi:hypothetical protein
MLKIVTPMSHLLKMMSLLLSGLRWLGRGRLKVDPTKSRLMIGGFRNIIGLGKNELSETTLNPFLWSYDLEILAR